MKVAVGLRRVAAGKRTSGRRAAQIAYNDISDIKEIISSLKLGYTPEEIAVDCQVKLTHFFVES